VKEFRSGTTKILISTDVLSRGFDVTQVCRHQLLHAWLGLSPLSQSHGLPPSASDVAV